MKYDFQKASTIPLLDIQGMPTVLKLKKRRFQCKDCRRVRVAETSLVQKTGRFPNLSGLKSHNSTQRDSLTQLSQRNSISPSLPFRESWNTSPSKRISPNFLQFWVGMNSLEIRANSPSLHKILRRGRSSPSLKTTGNQPLKTTSTSILEGFVSRLKWSRWICLAATFLSSHQTAFSLRQNCPWPFSHYSALKSGYDDH